MGSEEEISARAPPPATTLTTQLGLEVQTLTQLGLVEETAEDVCLDGRCSDVLGRFFKLSFLKAMYLMF